MNSIEKQISYRRRVQPNTGMIGLIDLLLIGLGFLLSALMVEGTVQIDKVNQIVVILSSGFCLFFFWCFEMYSIVLLKPQPTIVTAILSAIYTFVCVFLILLVATRKADYALFLALGNGIGYLLLCVWRILLYYYHKNHHNRQKMLMIEKIKDDNSSVVYNRYGRFKTVSLLAAVKFLS